MVNFPVTASVSGSTRIVPLGETLLNASVGGKVVVPPNGHLRGITRNGSILKATADTPTGPEAAVVWSEPWPNGSNYMTVEDLTIDGAQPVPDFAYGSAPEKSLTAHVCSGALLLAARGRVARTTVKFCRGNGIWAGVSNIGGANVIPMGIYNNNEITACWCGILNDYIDTQIYENVCTNMRDYGVLDLKGNIQSANNHYYGATYAMVWGDPVTWTVSSPTLGNNKSVNDTCADAHKGLWNLLSKDASVWDMYTQHCFECNMENWVPTKYYNCHTRVAQSSIAKPSIRGYCILGNGSRVQGGEIYTSAYGFTQDVLGVPQPEPRADNETQMGSTGIVLEAGSCTIKDVDIQAYTQANRIDGAGSTTVFNRQIGVHVKGGGATEKRQNNRIDVSCNGFTQTNSCGVKVDSGALDQGGNFIRVWGYNSEYGAFGSVGDKRLSLPVNWQVGAGGNTNRAWINETEILPGTYPVYPPTS